MKQFDIYLRDRIIELDVAIRELSLRNDISIRNNIQLLVNNVATNVQKYFAGRHEMELAENMPSTLKTAYEHIENSMQLDSDAIVSASKVAGRIDNTMRLDASTILLLQRWFFGCESAASVLLASKPTLSSKGYTSTLAAIQLLSENIATPEATKYASLEQNILSLNSSSAAAINYLLSTDGNTLNLDCSEMNAQIARYRLLGEMDEDDAQEPLALEAFDDMTLSEIDFVIME